MPIIVNIVMKNAVELSRSINQVSSAISSGSSGMGKRLSAEGLRIVRRITPKQRNPGNRQGSTKRGHPPLHRGWNIIEKTVSSSAYMAIIRNTAALDLNGLKVLASLEFGAKAHNITPKGKYLTWQEKGRSLSRFRGRSISSTGDLVEMSSKQNARGQVFAKKVVHPGHQPFYMVQNTRDHLHRTAQIVLRQHAKEIQNVFGGFEIGVQ